MNQTKPETALKTIIETLRNGNRFALASHARPDGDSIGSQVSLALALRKMGKEVVVVSHDPAPLYFLKFPGIDDLKITTTVEEQFDAVIMLECGYVDRAEISGLDKSFLINIDHHLGNTKYGTVNWIDESASACAEMVFELISSLGIMITKDIAKYIYVAILTDTGSFNHSHITARTFDICRQLMDSGIDPVEISACVYQNNHIGKIKLTGLMLNRMQLVNNDRIAILDVNDSILKKTCCTTDDLEGLINIPLTASNISAVILFKEFNEQIRVSLRSKSIIDVRSIAETYGGGGHLNAAGFTLSTPTDKSCHRVIAQVTEAIDASGITTTVDS
jgi:phosphoesterase RecJ-like protein